MPLTLHVTSDKPSPPTLLEALDVTADAVTLRWQPSAYDGGLPLKQYVIEKKEASKLNWMTAGRVEPGASPSCVGYDVSCLLWIHDLKCLLSGFIEP